MTTKDNLGRRIYDLIKENEILLKENEEVVEVKISDIKPNPHQPRIVFEKKALNELAGSIKEHGVIQPIIIKKVQDGYNLVSGERRLKASKIAGLNTIPALIRDYNTSNAAELAILENVQRENLTAIEEAIAYKKIIQKTAITHDELARKIGKSRSYITNIIGLLNLPQEIIDKVNSNHLSAGHAKLLSKIKDNQTVFEIAKIVIENKLNVRQTEDLIKRLKNPGKSDNQKKYMIKSLSDKLNVKPENINVRNNKLEIVFDSNKNLTKTIDRIVKKF